MSGILVPSQPVNHIVTGTQASEILYGTDYNDQIWGVGGNDTMIGGKGDDLYVVESQSDIVIEKPGEGIDTVRSWGPSYTLPDNVENLQLVGPTPNNGTGN